MRKPKKEIQLTSYDELLGINEAEQNTLNQIVEVPLNELHPFRRITGKEYEPGCGNRTGKALSFQKSSISCK